MHVSTLLQLQDCYSKMMENTQMIHFSFDSKDG